MVQIVRKTINKNKVEWKKQIESQPYNLKPVKKRVATFDTETDPFLYNRAVKPFACGFHIIDTNEYFDFWGDDCIDQFFKFIGDNFEENELLILVHNGGNFDFYFLTEYFDRGHSPFIINGRLVRVMAQGQEFRDSYTMIPVALGEYDKGHIDYRCFERGFREVYKEKILEYMKRDCISLGELVSSWYDMFGDKLTIASVALPTLRSHHGFENMSERIDSELRQYYFGGRNQCFETGKITGDFKLYDINSSYPWVMKNNIHPVSDIPKYEKKITDRTDFAHIRARSLGALPVRKKDGGLDFPVGTFDFYACIHEIKAGIETGTLEILKVYNSIYFEQKTNFSDFINKFYDLRLEASKNNDQIRKLFYKLVMNSSYGKFAQDPRKYENWLFDPENIPQPKYCDACYQNTKTNQNKAACESCESGKTWAYGWYLHTVRGDKNIYASPQQIRPRSFFNVATAASITSAARASLLKGIQCATRPVYCDTDSIICENLCGENIELHPTNLGAWDVEAKGDEIYIAGKKLYAVFSEGQLVKKASKGVTLTGDEIKRVCGGEVVEYAHPVPKFKLNGETQFTTRNISITQM